MSFSSFLLAGTLGAGGCLLDPLLRHPGTMIQASAQSQHGSLDTGTFDPFQPWFWLQVMLELRKLDGTAKEVT